MAPARTDTTPGPSPRRADAQRSIDRILDATLDALASDPEASMAAIARRAGVVRATVYVHFPTRENLIEAVTQRAISDVTDAIEAVEPARGDPADALRRVLTAAWRTLGRFHALVEVNTRLPHADLHAMHQPVLALLVPLIERGQRDGTFRVRRARRMASVDAARAHPRSERRALRRAHAASGRGSRAGEDRSRRDHRAVAGGPVE